MQLPHLVGLYNYLLVIPNLTHPETRASFCSIVLFDEGLHMSRGWYLSTHRLPRSCGGGWDRMVGGKNHILQSQVQTVDPSQGQTPVVYRSHASSINISLGKSR